MRKKYLQKVAQGVVKCEVLKVELVDKGVHDLDQVLRRRRNTFKKAKKKENAYRILVAKELANGGFAETDSCEKELCDRVSILVHKSVLLEELETLLGLARVELFDALFQELMKNVFLLEFARK